ncbi:MAG: magnesium transporter [Gammaproteobacteria bacterium]
METNKQYLTERRQHDIKLIRELLKKQKLVEELVGKQPGDKQELITALVHRQNLAELQSRLSRMHGADIAGILETLPQQECLLIWGQLSPLQQATILLELSAAVRQFVLQNQSSADITRIVQHFDADDLAYLAEEIPGDILEQRLHSLSNQEQQWLKSTLTYADDSVGALLSGELIRVREKHQVSQILQQLRDRQSLPDNCDKLFVINERGIYKGVLPLQTLLLNPPESVISDLTVNDYPYFRPEDDAAKATQAFERYDLISAPVIDHRDKLIGCVTVDAVMDYLREKSSEKTLNQAGINKNEHLFSSIWVSAKNRWAWLGINLLTAFIASHVIGLFEATIAQLVALAALMPIVASIGGNTGNQTVALIIRGISLGQVVPENIWFFIRKELGVSFLNGLIFGALVGLFSYALYRNMKLSIIITAAMLLNLMIAAAIGLLMPLLLHRFGKDPALGSSVLLTAATDSMGFFIFLGLATLFLCR